MKNKICFVLFLFMSIYIGWTDTLLIYETKEKDKTTQYETEFIKTATGYKQKSEKDIVYATSSFATYKFIYNDPETNSQYTAVKNGKKIKVTGTLNGKKENREFNLDNKEWFQSWDMAMMYFMTTDLDVYNFWCLRPDAIEIYEFEIKRMAKETINLKGKNIPTQKLHVGLTGFLSLLWGGMDNWVRLSDGIIIRSKSGDNETFLISEKPL